MGIFGIPDNTLLSFAGGVVATLILVALKNVLSKLIKIKPKQIGWLGLAAAGTAIYYTQYRFLSYYLFAASFFWIFFLVKGWRIGVIYGKIREKKKEKKGIKTSESRRSKGRFKKIIRI